MSARDLRVSRVTPPTSTRSEPTTPPTTPTTPTDEHPVKAFVTWLLTAKGAGVAAAGGLIVWASAMLLWDRVPTTCHDEISSTEAAKAPAELVVQVCEPMAATDPRVVLFLLVILLLLLPWFSEVEVAGLFSVKKQVEDARKEVDGLRESVRTAQAQVATLSATTIAQQVQQTKVEVQLHDHRREDSAETQEHALAGRPPDEVTAGAFAQVALTAALEGLHTLFPEECIPVGMVFFTWDETTLEQYGTVGDVDDDLQAVAYLMANTKKPKSWAHREPSGFLVLADATDDDGSSVGVVVFAFRQDQWEHHVAVFADVEVVAKAYARLLVDLVHETGRLVASYDDSEGGQ